MESKLGEFSANWAVENGETIAGEKDDEKEDEKEDDDIDFFLLLGDNGDAPSDGVSVVPADLTDFFSFLFLRDRGDRITFSMASSVP